jgi:hypothetical protein
MLIFLMFEHPFEDPLRFVGVGIDPKMFNVAALASGMAADRGNNVCGLVFNDAGERSPVAEPRSPNVELIDSFVEKRVELSLGFAAGFNNARVHLWHLDLVAAKALWEADVQS